MEAESIDLETVLLWSEQDIKYRYKLVVRAGKELNPDSSNRWDNTHHECLIALNQLDRTRPLSRYRERGSITTSRVLLPPPTTKYYAELQENEEPPQPITFKPAIPIQTNKQRQHQQQRRATRTRLAFVGRGQSDINFHQREEPDVRRGNICFGVEEDEAAAQSLEAPRRESRSASTSQSKPSLEAPRRESRSASTSQSKPSVKTTNRNKVTSPTDLHAGDRFGCDRVVKSPLTAPSGTGEAIGAREKGGARLGLRGNFGARGF
ncbi:hypothetical protein F2Q69_00026977 [Brassica cretica]|uniref:Uncharacterized protein n=1 Tax=Brassica cretica TaxID=69181 RepID=A0A8S9RUN6_BRACR|nr:hypothetical protein F2Q69_00026977 [Brassica cretica]